MEYTYPVTYLKCQFCQGKNHCRQCAAEVEAVRLDFQLKTAAVSGPDEDALLDALDAAGIFTD